MNRRRFLGLFSGFAASAVMDPERLLWVRGQKLISIPNETPLPAIMEFTAVGFDHYFKAVMLPLMIRAEKCAAVFDSAEGRASLLQYRELSYPDLRPHC